MNPLQLLSSVGWVFYHKIGVQNANCIHEWVMAGQIPEAAFPEDFPSHQIQGLSVEAVHRLSSTSLRADK